MCSRSAINWDFASRKNPRPGGQTDLHTGFADNMALARTADRRVAALFECHYFRTVVDAERGVTPGIFRTWITLGRRSRLKFPSLAMKLSETR